MSGLFNRLSQNPSMPYLIGIIVSAALSLMIAMRETVINPDAICYLMSAESIGQFGIGYAMHLCGQAKWPFYSVLIYGLVHLTHLSYAASAYALNGFFSILTVLFFMLIVKALGASRKVLWFALVVILLAHELNSVRQYIVRDHGFWACYLASVFFLVQYFRQPTFVKALAATLSLFIAALFRIEGAIFLLCIPFLAFFDSNTSFKERMKSFFALNFLTILLCVSAGLWLVMHPHDSLDKWGRVTEVFSQMQNGFSMMMTRFTTSKIALAHSVLTIDSASDAGLVLALVLIVWYLMAIIGNLSWPYAALVCYAWIKPRCIPSKSSLVLCGYLIINFLITFGFLLEHLFLSKRYLIALSLIFMLYVPFALADLIKKRSISYRIILVSLCLGIFISSLGGIIDFGYSKQYIREAGDWIADNVPQEANLYANDYQLMYYSHHFGADLFEKLPSYVQLDSIANDRWKQYDYIALRLNKKEMYKTQAVLQALPLQAIKDFSNKRGDYVAIYKVPKESLR